MWMASRWLWSNALVEGEEFARSHKPALAGASLETQRSAFSTRVAGRTLSGARAPNVSDRRDELASPKANRRNDRTGYPPSVLVLGREGKRPGDWVLSGTADSLIEQINMDRANRENDVLDTPPATGGPPETQPTASTQTSRVLHQTRDNPETAPYHPNGAIAATTHSKYHTPTSGGTTGTQSVAPKGGQVRRGDQHNHGGTGTADDDGAAAAGPCTVGCLHAWRSPRRGTRQTATTQPANKAPERPPPRPLMQTPLPAPRTAIVPPPTPPTPKPRAATATTPPAPTQLNARQRRTQQRIRDHWAKLQSSQQHRLEKPATTSTTPAAPSESTPVRQQQESTTPLFTEAPVLEVAIPTGEANRPLTTRRYGNITGRGGETVGRRGRKSR
ncbi:hypothetical protein QTP88_011421 [Uroleucon formosanum]